HIIMRPGVVLQIKSVPPRPTLFPYTTLFRSIAQPAGAGTQALIHRGAFLTGQAHDVGQVVEVAEAELPGKDVQRFPRRGARPARSEEHTSELQSRENLVCRLLLEKKKNRDIT